MNGSSSIGIGGKVVAGLGIDQRSLQAASTAREAARRRELGPRGKNRIHRILVPRQSTWDTGMLIVSGGTIPAGPLGAFDCKGRVRPAFPPFLGRSLKMFRMLVALGSHCAWP